MKKRRIYALFIVLVVLSAIFVAGYIYLVSIPRSRAAEDSDNPLRKSVEEVREYLFEFTPIGMSMEDVIKVIKNNEEWETDYIDYESGYGVDEWGAPSESGKIRIGEKGIRVTIGFYSAFTRTAKVLGFAETAVTAFYGFDEDSKLINISVRKDTDAV